MEPGEKVQPIVLVHLPEKCGATNLTFQCRVACTKEQVCIDPTLQIPTTPILAKGVAEHDQWATRQKVPRGNTPPNRIPNTTTPKTCTN